MLSEETRKSFIELLKQEVKPALGCTEPIAVALAVAKAKEALAESVERVVIEVSANILKNGMGVGIPGTGMIGLDIAAALGVACGNSAFGLEVLKEVDSSVVSVAKEIVANNLIEITVADTAEKLYIKAICYSGDNNAVAVISSMHDNIVYVAKNDDIILDKTHIEVSDEADSGAKDTKSFGLTVEKIFEFATTEPVENIKFMLETETLNRRLSKEGLTFDYGLMVGKSIGNNLHKNVFGSSGILPYAMSITAAASDARMAGCTLPAMSNSGSGNQGIAVTMPVVAVHDKLGLSNDELVRALTMSHLIAIHIKSYLGRLSALCGCVVASTGASGGITYLMGGDYKNVTYSIKNMIGNVTGMVCDGAKVGCAMKVASGVSSSVQSAILAIDGICISANDGIIENDIERTIANLGRVGSEGMQETDKVMLDIMINKNRNVVVCD